MPHVHIRSDSRLVRGRLTFQVLAMVHGQVADIVVGSIFLFIGLAASFIAVIRRRSGVRIFVWLGIWSAK